MVLLSPFLLNTEDAAVNESHPGRFAMCASKCCQALSLVATAALLASGTLALAADEQQLAQQIIQQTGVRGGLIVHINCGDAKLTNALAISESFLVHGLDTNAAKVRVARENVQASGRYGRVSIDTWDGRKLPYVDNLVNLVVAQQGAPATDELLRVLVPGGVAYVQRDGRWTKSVKPRTKKIDDWTHYLHDASGNPVARDRVVGPPRHMQWVGSPTWTRHHDHMSSFSAMVSANGRVFYIIDEGPRAEIQLPPEWMLVARDAFNGAVLWKRPLNDWHTHLWPLKSGPAQLPRRLVAVGDTVYMTPGLRAPVTAIDAATGKTVRTYEQTRATDEIIVRDGVLLVVVNEKPAEKPWSTQRTHASYDQLRSEPEKWAWDGAARAIVAVEANSGETLWRHKSAVAPMTLAADKDHVYFFDGNKVAALGRSSGKVQWASQPLPAAKPIRTWFAPTLVVNDGVIVFAGGEKIARHRGGNDTMTALDAASGKALWSAAHPASGYDSPEDVFIIDGLVWTAPTTNRRDTGKFTGRDLRTGKVMRTFPADDGDHMPHHRCHPAKATEKFILASRTGIEYVDLEAKHWNRNDWVRGACLYGIMPANGLTYAPPQSCACYLVAKLNGLNALAADTPGRRVPETIPTAGRIETGPAYGKVSLATGDKTDPLDWPTYRGSAQRSGSTRAAVPAALKQTWQTKLGGRLSSPVIAEGRAFVASIDRHAVHALDMDTGRSLWTFTAGGRIDSPPTIWRSGVYFGSADGWIYCLRSTDGAMAWRFRAAARDQRLAAFEQLESVWPVHGSVLIREGVIHAVAGRSMFLDGGLRYVRLDAGTGELLSETILDDRHPKTRKKLDAAIRWPNLPVALPDILSCDGKSIYMRSQAFDLKGNRRDVTAPKDYRDQSGDGAHLFCATGFLDDSWWHRTYWMYGKTPVSGAGGWYLAAYRAPTGRIMAIDDERVYAFERQPQYFPRTTALEYHVYATKKRPEIIGGPAKTSTRRNRPRPSRPAYEWSYQVPLLGRALVKTADTLYVAGPPDLVEQEKTITRLDDPRSAAKLADQAAALAGKKGGLLLALSTENGTPQGVWHLASIPVFDGLAATRGRLVMTTVDGHVVCFGAKGTPLEPATEIKELNKPNFDAAPSGTARGGTGIRLTARHPNFQHLTKVAVSSSELGYRVQTPSGQVGLAIKKLSTPLTKRATFRLKLRMIPKDASARPPGNGFLVFGAAAEDARLVKCGLRNAGQQTMIVQGPLLSGKSKSQPVKSKTNQTMDLKVDVDLDKQTVTMRLLGKTVETKLTDSLNAITHIGYAVHSVACEFSAIEVSGE